MQASSSPASRHHVMKSLFIYYFVQVLRFILLSCSYWPFLLFLLSWSYYKRERKKKLREKAKFKVGLTDSYCLTVLLLLSYCLALTDSYCLALTVLLSFSYWLLLSCSYCLADLRGILLLLPLLSYCLALTVLIVWIWYRWLNLSLIFPLMSMSPHSNCVTVLLSCLFLLSCFVGLLACCLAGLLVVVLIVCWFVVFGSLDLKKWNSMMLETLIIYILSHWLRLVYVNMAEIGIC
jgi:hypothetical protein